MQRFLPMCAVLMVLCAATPVAHAAAAVKTPAAAAKTEGDQISSADMQKFAATQHNIAALTAEWQADLKNASTDAQKMALQKQMNTKLVQTVRASGLNIDQYNLIAHLVSTDPEYTAKFQAAEKALGKK